MRGHGIHVRTCVNVCRIPYVDILNRTSKEPVFLHGLQVYSQVQKEDTVAKKYDVMLMQHFVNKGKFTGMGAGRHGGYSC